MQRFVSLPFTNWQPEEISEKNKKDLDLLEEGSVLYFPDLTFSVTDEEKKSFSPNLVEKNRKNISFFEGSCKGCEGSPETREIIRRMMQRFADASSAFLSSLFPEYEKNLVRGRTSFRPVEIEGRKAPSYRKDDTLLHIDAFPSSPTQGNRILRFFANVNPFNVDRVWNIGEPYTDVLHHFLPMMKKPLPFFRFLLHRLGITKSYRSLYDHYMLRMHHAMKADASYQKEVRKETVRFPSGTCWLVFTDQASHAVLSGQYVLEQSFYLPAESQKFPEKSPLHRIKSFLSEK